MHGGLGGAPKFPPSAVLAFLLREGPPTRSAWPPGPCAPWPSRGTYDQVEGGFARYSVDAGWVVPHFEKMLYDNAQLARVYARWSCRPRRPATPSTRRRARGSRSRRATGWSTRWAPPRGPGQRAGRRHARPARRRVARRAAHVGAADDEPRRRGAHVRVDPGRPRGRAGGGRRGLGGRAARGDGRRDLRARHVDRAPHAGRVAHPGRGRAVGPGPRGPARRPGRRAPSPPGTTRSSPRGTAWRSPRSPSAGALLDRPDLVEAARQVAGVLLDRHGEEDAEGRLRLRRVSRDGSVGVHAGVLEDHGDVAAGLLVLHGVDGDPAGPRRPSGCAAP